MNYLYIFSFVLAIGLSFYVYGLKKGAWYFFITFFIILLGIIADDLLFPYTTIIAILILCTRLYELIIWIVFICLGIYIGNYVQHNKTEVKDKLKNFIDRL